ncbi:MAG: glutamine-synthetase adenylyltransferase, partial [Pseudoxanthomonas sp.]
MTATNAMIEALVERGLASLRNRSAEAAELLADAAFADRVGRVVAASDFALETLRRQPVLLTMLERDDGAEAFAPPTLAAEEPARWQERLRAYRTAESTRLVWRDVLGLDDVDA